MRPWPTSTPASSICGLRSTRKQRTPLNNPSSLIRLPLKLTTLGQSLAFQKKYKQAVTAFQGAIELDKSCSSHNQHGLSYTQMGQLKYAEFVYKLLVRDHPDYAPGYDGMAVTLAKSGRASEAIALQEKAISLSPDSPVFFTFLVLVIW